MNRLFLVASLGIGLFLGVALGFGAPEEILLDGNGSGRAFEGIGMVNSSGTSKLLRDYPLTVQNDILDLLFRPGFGASLSVVKNEIGADANSSTGTEPCHQRLKDDPPTARGVNFWICREAKQRDPSIRFVAARWAIPAWADRNKETKRDYTLSYLRLMASNGTPVDDLSPEENEGKFDRGYVVKTLAPALAADPLFARVRLIARDEVNGWNIAGEVAKDETLKKTLSALTSHYTAVSTDAAKASGLPLYNDECDTPMRDRWPRLMFVAKNLARQYIEGRMVRGLYQPALDGVYETLKYNYKGILTAITPWSGHYEIHPALWMTAQFTQFALPGWKFLDGACGSVDSDNYYLSLRDPSGPDYCVIFVNAGKEDRDYVLKPTGGLSQGPVHVWSTTEKESFGRMPDIPLKGGALSVTVAAQSVCSLTTRIGPHKGSPAGPIPLDQVMPLPYIDDFASGEIGDAPRFTLDQAGAFELAETQGRRCLQQAVSVPPVDWWDKGPSKRYPYTVLGDSRWTDYRVGADVLLGKKEWAYVSGRGNLHQRDGDAPASGYQVLLETEGRWVFRKVVEGEPTTFKVGQLPEFKKDSWHRLMVGMKGTSVEAWVDGKRLDVVTDESLFSGQAALGCSFGNVCFADLRIEPAGPSGAPYACERRDDTDPSIHYGGAWLNDQDGAWADEDRTVRRSNVAGSTVDFSFNGTGFCWVGRKDVDGGQAQVTVDGVPQSAVDLYQPKTVHRAPIFRKTGLAPGLHQVRLKVTGRKNPKSKDAFVYVDAVECLSGPAVKAPSSRKAGK